MIIMIVTISLLLHDYFYDYLFMAHGSRLMAHGLGPSWVWGRAPSPPAATPTSLIRDALVLYPQNTS